MPAWTNSNSPTHFGYDNLLTALFAANTMLRNLEIPNKFGCLEAASPTSAELNLQVGIA
jgi:hypothetical protein